MLPHNCSLFLFIAELDECIATIAILAFLHLDHRQVALVLEVILDLLFSRGRLHPKQDHVPTVGIILVSNTFCLNNKTLVKGVLKNDKKKVSLPPHQ